MSINISFKSQIQLKILIMNPFLLHLEFCIFIEMVTNESAYVIKADLCSE